MTRPMAPLLTSILSAASSALSDGGVPVGLVHLAPGSTPAWDNCCAGGGQLWLRVVETFPTAGVGVAFPAIDSAQKAGVRLLALRLALGAMRCAHTIDDRGRFPTADQMTGDALRTLDDLGLLLDVIACDVPEISGVMSVKVDRWSPLGVQGGCAGGEWGFYVAFDPCLCTPLPEA